MRLADLSEQRRFVAWQLEPVEGENRKVKAPYRANGALSHARINAPEDWGSHAEAATQAGRLPKPLGLGGVGVILGPLGPGGLVLAGIDLDSCRSPVDGTVAPWAQAVVDRFTSYTEVSPSGTGLHVIFLARQEDVDLLPRQCIWKRGGGDHPPSIEVYREARYFTLDPERLYDELGQVSLATLRWLADEHAPAWAGATQGAAGSRGRDGSRSADAVRLAIRLLRAGKVYEDFPAALLNDPALADWYREKGVKNDHRETKRAWEAALRAVAVNGAEFEELNERFAVVAVKDRTMILDERVDVDGRPSYDLLTRDNFRLRLSDRRVMVGSKQVPIADLWLAWSGRRTYQGVVFRPSGAPPDFYNLWRGWAVTASSNGSCKLFKDHLLDNVCGGDRQKFTWLFGWYADLFQNPEKKPGTAVVLRGNQGVGKSIVGATIGKLLGDYYTPTGSGRYVTGQFNAHLKTTLLLHCDEAFWAGDKRAESVLKDLITGNRHLIEHKGVDPYVEVNFVRVMATGDQDWLIPAGPRERRFGVFDVQEGHIQDNAYFKAIITELEAGGYERLLYELLTFDLAQVDLGVIPVNDGLLDQKIASFTPEQNWYFDVLKEGKLPFGCGGPRCCPSSALFDHYINHARKQGVGRRSAETRFGRFLRKMVGPGFQRYRETYKNNQFGEEVRGFVYELPSLNECRTRFAVDIHHPVTWDDEERDWEKALPPLAAVPNF